jgi:hypothetical protein
MAPKDDLICYKRQCGLSQKKAAGAGRGDGVRVAQQQSFLEVANGDQWSATFSYYNTENQYTLVKQVKVYCDLTCDSIFIFLTPTLPQSL